jgi:hypothetical protein
MSIAIAEDQAFIYRSGIRAGRAMSMNMSIYGYIRD